MTSNEDRIAVPVPEPVRKESCATCYYRTRKPPGWMRDVVFPDLNAGFCRVEPWPINVSIGPASPLALTPEAMQGMGQRQNISFQQIPVVVQGDDWCGQWREAG